MIPGVVASQITAVPTPKTATPSNISAYCLDDGMGNKIIYVEVKNNDASSVTMYSSGVSKGTWSAGQTKSFSIATDPSLPYNWSVSITALASGKTLSDEATGSGSVNFCILL